MSGGSLDYFYMTLADHEHDLGDKELNNLISDLAELFHSREWFLSGDISEGAWRKEKKNFKEKWFSQHGRQERIEAYLNEFSDEIREELGISKKYCFSCSHFTPDKKYTAYGSCEFESRCLYHTHEKCNKWEERNAPD